MPRKKSTDTVVPEIELAPINPQPITETIEKNYMPYAMSVIVSRAIPEIDGLKPAHRKLLYTMYKMGLLTGARTKSTKVVGDTMKLNPHGDAAIYETLVRLTRGNATLLHPFVDSKGSFGKQYSSEMMYAASRYTEVKLDEFSAELFRGIDKNAVELVDNYDGSMKEPVLLPTTFPNILITPNSGIAVGMASEICSFNLAEVCDGTIALLRKPNLPLEKLMEIIKAPDFSGGGALLYEEDAMREVFETGSGTIRLRARYRYVKAENCIEVIQIPYSTTIEQIIKKLSDLVKAGKLKEVTDFRDEIDLSGFKLTLDIRRGVDPDQLMLKLFRLTPFESSFKCNFNVLIDSTPRRLGVRDILLEWIRFRMRCLRRELSYTLTQKKDKLHLLEGLGKIILDIDKAIRIIRKTEEEEKVIPNLMEGFDIDEIQANYIAEIKLRNLNRKYLLDRIEEIKNLQEEIEEIEGILADELKLKALIYKQLLEVKQKYGKPRETMILYPPFPTYDAGEEEKPEVIPSRLVFTEEGYFKRLSLVSRAASSPEDMRMKEGDRIAQDFPEVRGDEDILAFSDRGQAYRAHVADFEIVKASQMGDYLASKLGMDEGERAVLIYLIRGELSEKEHLCLFFANGKGVRVPLNAFETKSFRRRLTGAYSDASPLVGIGIEPADKHLECFFETNDHKGILIKSSLVAEKATRTAGGVQLINLKPGMTVTRVTCRSAADGCFKNATCRKIKVPATPQELKPADYPAEPAAGTPEADK